jgi:phosphatidylethanolamine/phosphatidyl-N-methylethanolamine N-methyltransferase
MARPIDPRKPGPIIELGPGTGVVTEALLERGVPAHRLVLIEAQRSFCRLLGKRFPGIRVLEGDAFALDEIVSKLELEPVAAVVSSLPLLTHPPARRVALLETALQSMQPDGVFVQFTYGVRPPIPFDEHAVSASASRRIWWNLWPARVWRYRNAGASTITTFGR